MKNRFSISIYWVIVFLPLIVTGVMFPDFPKIIPAHFNAMGQINRYGNRTELFIFPIIIIVLAIFSWLFIAYIGKFTSGLNSKIFQISRLVMVSTLSVISIVILAVISRSVQAQSIPDFYKILAVLIGLGDVIMANYLPKSKRNGGVGVRTTWTLQSDEIWHKTHRFAGWLITIGGICCIVIAMFFREIFSLLIVCAGEIVMLTIVLAYSYTISKKGEPK